MPSDNNNQTWLDNALSEVAKPKSPLLPIIQDFKSFIENNGDMYKGFHEMFEGATDPFVSDTQFNNGISPLSQPKDYQSIKHVSRKTE
jgi:hypothetical protein